MGEWMTRLKHTIATRLATAENDFRQFVRAMAHLTIRIATCLATALRELPQFIQDFIKGVSTGLAVTMPFLAIWLSFNHPRTFAFAYMKEISLLILWLLAIVHLFPLKSLKAGKDGVQLEFLDASGIPPKDAVAT